MTSRKSITVVRGSLTSSGNCFLRLVGEWAFRASVLGCEGALSGHVRVPQAEQNSRDLRNTQIS